MGLDTWYPQENDYSGGGSKVYELLNENRLGHLSDAEMNAAIDELRTKNNYGQIKKYLLQNRSCTRRTLP